MIDDMSDGPDSGSATEAQVAEVSSSGWPGVLVAVGVAVAVSVGLYLSSLYDYLLFHSVVEIATIAIGFMLFVLVWNTRQFYSNGFLSILGIGYASIALIDLIHTLAYKGMGVFVGYDANLPTQLWIAARYLQAFTILAALLFVDRKVDNRLVLGVYAVVVSAVTALVFSGYFPDAFVEGSGLTPFKVNSEYVITALLLLGLYLLFRQRERFDTTVFRLVVASILCTAFSELSFTAYVSVYGFANLLGHLLKLAAFYLIYRAILVTGFQMPFDLIFRSLSQANNELLVTSEHLAEEIGQRKTVEEQLRQSRDELELKVQERTRAFRVLSESNQMLMHATDEGRLLEDVCRIVVEIGGYALCWVGFVEHDEEKSVRPVASAGNEADYVEHITVTWGTGPTGQGPSGLSIREKRPVAVRDLQSDPLYAPWVDEATSRGLRSSISLPLLDSVGEVFGTIAIYSDQPLSFDAEEMDLLAELAGDLSFGIRTLRERQAGTRAEAEVREAARYARTVIDASLDPIALISAEGKITDANRAAEEMLGVSRGQLLGADFAQPFTDPELAQAGLRKVIEVGSARDFPLTLTRPSGERVDVLFNATVYRDEAGEIQGILTVARDVTEWKRAQEQAARLAAIVTSSQDAIITRDLEGVITSWNAAAEVLYGYSAEEMTGRTVDVLVPQNRADEPRELVERARRGERISGFETQRKRKDGSTVDVSLTLSPIYDETGAIAAISVIGRDITERKQAEEDRLARLRFAENMDRVNRAIQGAGNLDQMTSDVLDEVLAMFECDRAFLMYPCDPDSPEWAVPMERNRPEYPGALALGLQVPMSEAVAETLRVLRAADGPVRFGAGTEHPLPEDASERFGFRSFMSVALYPRIGKPWQFGLHQCSYAREWTDEDAGLLREVGRRLEDALSTLLVHRDLERSEAKYRRIIETATEGVWVLGPDTMTTFVNARMADMLGVSEESMAGRPVTDFMFDEDASDHLAKMENRRRGKSEEYERRFRRADGQEVWTHVSAVPIFDDQRRFTGAMGMFTDITERRRAEDALRRRKDELERFERLVVGRELRMRELKDRVGRLEGALAQARRDEDDES
jgi:PAS domain S-box-containing protein